MAAPEDEVTRAEELQQPHAPSQPAVRLQVRCSVKDEEEPEGFPQVELCWGPEGEEEESKEQLAAAEGPEHEPGELLTLNTDNASDADEAWNMAEVLDPPWTE